uniref:Cysteine dioxygenase n=1 Tax=Globisporangium ultimum (strain ATCC 200006 / CBS 805.95 / DAOM BR144) TaxID=431595 RepID=K3WU71_GLOUD
MENAAQHAATVMAPPSHSPKQHATPSNLEELVDAIEAELFDNDAQKHLPLHKKSDLQALLERFPVNMDELKQFAHFDPSRNYTRNLISTDHETYALMLLCWNRGKYSPIHDHPSDGCWVKVIQGHVNEVRYQKQGSKLVETANTVLTSGVTYMDDSLGLHKVGNPHAEIDAITMHLYSPPYEKCRVWFDPEDADKSSVAVSNYYTEFGQRIEF